MTKNYSTLGLQIIRLKIVFDTFGCYIAIYQLQYWQYITTFIVSIFTIHIVTICTVVVLFEGMNGHI